MQLRMNLKIKYRESFRPFAPSVLAEDAEKYFQIKDTSRYMLIVGEVKKEIQNALPPGFHELPIKERLYFERSSLPAITHLDYSARVQTVEKEINPRFWGLLNEFKAQTSCPVLVNTSFNVRGEPIVRTVEDAFRCFMRTEMDYLVVGRCILSKGNQVVEDDNKEWEREFELD